MKDLAVSPVQELSVWVGSPEGVKGLLEFFAAHIRNGNTRRAYVHAASAFARFCRERGVHRLAEVQPLHVAAWVELNNRTFSPATSKQRLAAVRSLFDWMAARSLISSNPAAYVKGPRYSVRKGKTPVLQPDEARKVLASIGTERFIDLRDRALIALMLFTFARVGAALAMNVEDLFQMGPRLWVRLKEKGGKVHEMPCHHELEEALHTYLRALPEGSDPTAPLFRSVNPPTREPSANRLLQASAYRIVQRRCRAVGVGGKVGNHSLRATGITSYLANGGTIERAAIMANHTSIRTTQLYDRRDDAITLTEVERIRF